jgi:hypothetical protein
VLTLVGEEVEGTKTKFGLAECPFIERAHRGQRVGVRQKRDHLRSNDPSTRVCVLLGRLRKLLKERTGKPTPQIFEDEGSDNDDDEPGPLPVPYAPLAPEPVTHRPLTVEELTQRLGSLPG